jgi:serine/threonine protein kinase
VVLKVLGSDAARARPVERLENEFRIAAKVGTGAVVRPIALDRFQGDPALVLEDVAGATLDRVVQGRSSWAASCGWRWRRPTALEDVHRHGVIHKDLKPPNLMVDEDAGQVRISGFGSASLMPRELQAARNPTASRGPWRTCRPSRPGACTGRWTRAPICTRWG